VRPLLSGKCYSCHSSKARPRFANLNLDSPAGIAKGGDSGPAVSPGKPAESILIRAVRGQLPAPMPPGGKLTTAQIETLVRWIEIGAPMPREAAGAPLQSPSAFDLDQRRREHWAWQPPKAAQVPQPARRDWAIEPIDHFVLARLERERLSPAGPALRRTWLRRLSFDLTGLPPSPADLDAFDNDNSPEAHRKQIARLLDSPRFGEHWARHWMDLVRYAESHGSEGDPDTPQAWRYRDYLIRALNADVPYDRLLGEHIAGDLLPDPRLDERDRINESLLATANLRLVEHGFQPVDPWEDRIKWTDNQIDVFSKAFQGLTISCARCHDHKFDAVSQRDYYALFGIFANARPTQVPIDLPEDLGRNLDALRQSKREVHDSLAARWLGELKALPERMQSFEFEVEHEAAACDPDSPLALWWKVRRAKAAIFGETWTRLAGEARARAESRGRHNAVRLRRVWNLRQGQAKDWIVRGSGPSLKPSLPGEFWIRPDGPRAIGAIYPSGIFTNLLSNKHAGVITSPRFKIDTDFISVQMAGGGHSFAQLIIENYAVPRGGIYAQRFVPKSDGLEWRTWDTSFWKGFTAYVEFATYDDVTHAMPDFEPGVKPKPPKDGRSWIGASMVSFHDEKGSPKPEWLPIDSIFEGPAPDSSSDLAARFAGRIGEAVAAWRAGTISDRQAAFLNYFVSVGVLSAGQDEVITNYRRLEADVPVPRRAPGVLEEGGADQHLLVRGNHKSPGPLVPKRYLQALGSAPYADSRSARLRLAAEVASPSNPLTARVMVNRIWRYMFGRGLVSTVDNFGKLGERPSHPELLDWLADRFVREGWSIKKMIAMIANSQAYRMESTAHPQAAVVDPANALLSHMPVKRLEAEAIRDSILWVSGHLDGTMYGEPVDTYYSHDTGKTKGDKPKGPLDGDGRRSVYLEVRRNVTNPFLEVFDLPKAATTRGERDITNVPAQSLALLNSPFVIDQAAKWARSTSGAPPSRIEEMFLRAFGRRPAPVETDRAESFLARVREERAGKPDAEQAAWADLAHSLFNFKEFIYVR
jgi:hypothetical protein